MMRATLSRAVMAAVLVMAAGSARADLMTYTITGTVSGSLNGTRFADDSVTITTTADTADVVGIPGFYSVLAPAPTILVGGFGPATLGTPVNVFVNQSKSTAGIYPVIDGSDLLDTVAAPFATYDLTTAIGPVSGTPLYSQGVAFETSLGELIFTSASDPTFRASPAAVPEPSSLALCALGLVGAAAYRRRGSRRAFPRPR